MVGWGDFPFSNSSNEYKALKNRKAIENREIEVFKKSFPFKVRFIVFVVGAY